MHSYNSKIIKSEQSKTQVVEYKAKKIVSEVPIVVSKSADFQAEVTGDAGSFRMDELLMERTGIGQKRQEEIMGQVEELTIERLKEIEEEAYKKAYDLGFQEGHGDGVKQATQEVSKALDNLNSLVEELHFVRQRLLLENEPEMIRMIYMFASKLAIRNIQEDESYIIDCVRNLVDSLQSDTETRLKVSEKDFDFIESFLEKDIKTKELFKNIKLMKDESLQIGECLFESNSGEVLATMEERFEKLWSSLKENFPKIVPAEEAS